MSMLTDIKELETSEKRKKPEENTPVIWKRNVSPHCLENCLLEGRVSSNFMKVLQLSISMNLLLILMF